METKLITKKSIPEAARAIRSGKLVAFPTETVYGLGADALNGEAVKKIFIAKGRPADNPVIVHIADIKDAEKLAVKIPESAKKLMDKFWPGPLTIILKKKPGIPDAVTAGLDSIAIRMPNNKVALELIKASGTPIAAPSANLSGRTSPTCAEHVIIDLNGKIEMIIDGGKTKIGVESSVIDLTNNVPMILRPGRITKTELEETLGMKIALYKHSKNKNEKIRSPGLKHRHYAPKAELIIFKGNKKKVKNEIEKLAVEFHKEGIKTGILAFHNGKYKAKNVIYYHGNLEKIAHDLFFQLRDFDEKKIKVIISEAVDKRGLGTAIMDRLERAADNRIVRVR